jgi:hypothetical protein
MAVGWLRPDRERVTSVFISIISVCIPALVALCSIHPPAAFAAEGDIRGVVRAVGLANSDIGESVFDGRLDFEAETGRFILGATYRAYELSNADYNPRQAYSDPFGIKHRYAEFNADDLGLRAGDYFVTFGKGLMLRSFEEIALEHDTALDGVLGEYSTGPLEITGVAGGMDDRRSETLRWQHNVYGVRARTSFLSSVNLGASGLKRFQRKRDDGISLPDSTSDFEDVVIGADAETWVGPVTLNAEYVRRTGDYYFESEQSGAAGYGTYVGGSYGNAWLSLLAEYKNYYRFENAVINPPTCIKEHVWTLMNRATHLVNLNDERGFIVEGVLTPSDDMTLDGGASEARHRNGDLLHWEIFGQADYIRSDLVSAALAVSWSREYDLGKFTEHLSWALESDISIGEQVLEITLEGQNTEEPSGYDFRDLLTSIAYYPRYDITVVGMFEHTTHEEAGRDAWFFLDIRMTIADGYEVSLGGGTERGGKKCAGGICFDEPEFAGLKARFLTYF